jgi:hypothetical protein
MGSARADDDGEPFFTSTPTAKRDARTRQLVDAERLVAETHRSGVRAKSAETDASPGFDISNAVTKVQRAVELDAFLPPTVEVTVVVSETIPLAPRPTTPSIEVAADVGESPAPGAFAAQSPRQSVSSVPGHAGRVRRFVSALLVVAVMAGACALLVAAARRGRLPSHPALAPLVERVARLLR